MGESRPKRPFLRNPWWRDWVLACVLIGTGFTFSSPHMPARWVAFGVLILGAAIFLAAVGHGVWTGRW